MAVPDTITVLIRDIMEMIPRAMAMDSISVYTPVFAKAVQFEATAKCRVLYREPPGSRGIIPMTRKIAAGSFCSLAIISEKRVSMAAAIM